MTYQKICFISVLVLIAVMSLAAFIAFAADKRRAVGGKDRVKEKTLLTLAACFGAPGALLGRIAAHHKTGKVYFSIVLWASLVLQAGLVLYIGYLAFIR